MIQLNGRRFYTDIHEDLPSDSTIGLKGAFLLLGSLLLMIVCYDLQILN